MKKHSLCLSLAAAMSFLIFCSHGQGPFYGGAGNRTGSAGSPAGCSGGVGGCHANTAINTTLNILLYDSAGVSVSAYKPVSTYRVQLNETVPGATRPRFGFQASCVRASDAATQAGDFSTGSTTNIAVYNGAPQLIEHTSPLVGAVAGGNVLDTVSFLWKAPVTGVGKVRFYAALNAVNFDNDSTGDRWRTATFELDGPALGIESFNAAALHVFPNPAGGTVTLTGVAPGAAVYVLDGAGRMLLNSAANDKGCATINVAGLVSGHYYLYLPAGSGKQGLSFFKY